MAFTNPLFFFTFALAFASFVAADSDLLQDVCAGDINNGIKVNGFLCKQSYTADDFFFTGLATPGAANNTLTGALVTGANVEKIPGLNTLGVSMSRIDYAPGGLNAPHTHPRASEIAFVIEGELDVGFITTTNALISKTVKQGEVFVFPKGLVHFQKNNGDVPAAVISAFNSQNPGTQQIGLSLFASTPPVPDYVFTTAFGFTSKDVQKIRSKLAPKK